MTLLSKTLNGLGLLLLIHACYSAHEHSSLPNPISSSQSTASSITSSSSNVPIASAAAPATSTLPLDITLETLASVLLLCLGLVLGSSELKPIEWRVWAGEVERGRGGVEVKEGGGYVGNPFGGLEERSGFADVRARRRDFADWVREQDRVEEKR